MHGAAAVSRHLALLIVMPGPDTAVVTKNALVGGRRAGVSPPSASRSG
jgi:threonine/homoserine/homoserine lactone efflux protein